MPIYLNQLMSLNRIIIGAALWLLCCSSALSAAGNSRELPVVTMGCAIPSQSPVFDLMKVIYKEPFERLGYQLNLLSLPNRRVQAMLHQGELVGVCARPDYFLDQMGLPSLSLIPTVVGYDTVREYSLRSTNLSSIDKKRVGYVRGHLGAQKALDDTADTVILLGSAQSSNLMLLSNRIDAFVGLEIEMALGLKKYDGDADIVSRKLGEVSFYSYLTDFFTDQQKAEFNSYLGEHIAAQGGPLSIADVFPAEFIERLRQERE